MALNDGMLGMSGRDTDFNLGVFAGKVREFLGEEGPVKLTDQSLKVEVCYVLSWDSQHATRAAAVVAVVEVKAFAL